MKPASDAALQLGDQVQFLPGVGPARAEALKKLGVLTVGDLLEYFPFRYDRHESRVIENLLEGTTASVVGEITAVRRKFSPRGPTVSATMADNTGRCSLSWFNAPWMMDRIHQGAIVRATGKVSVYQGLAQLLNPTITVLGEDGVAVDRPGVDRLEPVYPASGAISSRQISRIIQAQLDRLLERVTDFHPAALLKKRGLTDRRRALRAIHRPANEREHDVARRRLAYDELLFMQLATGLMRYHRRREGAAPALPCTQEINRRIRRRFPFTLTTGQDRAIQAIAADLARPRPMNRLLQGDVGCGKTVVALYAALVAVANKTQAAIMAPTEILAEQHARAIGQYLADSRVRHRLLVGGLAARERTQLLRQIAAGEVDLVVGTHALIEQDVVFDKLGLVIVDEQHRFGVRQRAFMRLKGRSPHYLVMTATPIPRTLAMTVFGDLDVTTIDELPPGRSPVQTRVVPPAKQQQAWDYVRGRLDKGEQSFVVYPIIDESDKLEVRAATVEYERLRKTALSRYRVGLLHGRLKREERDAVMADLVTGQIDVLVATTVIEVGIDVPNATGMIIEHAERYGLSQLHQLRGRVGRGRRGGYCFLMSDSAEGDNERLEVLSRTGDGFKIAEEDLRLRGPGEMLGTRQHGLPELRVADLLRDGELLRHAQQDADEMIRADPQLRRPEHADVRAALMTKYGETLAFLDVA